LRDTIDEFAVRLGVGVSTAGDWESNPAVVPHAVNQRALDTSLYRADDECKRRFGLLTRGNRHVLVTDLAGLNGNGVVTHRRDATTAAAGGLVTAFAPMEVLERIAVQNEFPIDAGLVAAHEKFADALAELGPITTRLDLICEQVAQQADDLLGLLDRPAREVDRRRVEVAAVSSCAYAGMTALCRADRRLARHYFALARSVAEDSGDDTLRARALGVGATLLSPMLGSRGGDPRPVAALLSEAVHYAHHADPTTRVVLHWWLATALARKRDELGFRRAVEAADRLAGRVGTRDGSGWLARHFAYEGGGPVRDKSLGISLLLLRRPDPAVEAFTQALAAVNPSWGAWRVTVLVDTAAAQVLQGEPESACAGLQEVIGLTKQVGYGMGVQRIRGVRAGFPPEWAGLSCVRELDEQLRLAA
jgi:hypothetical protein